MELTHLGHACLLVEVADQRILIDPGTFSDFAEQRDLTAILVTHQHADHLDPARWEQLLADNPQAQVWLEPATAAQVGGRGEPMTAGEVVQLGSTGVMPIGEQHAFIHDYVPRITNLGLVLRAPGEPTLFHPGDALDAEPGEVDVLCVPVNAPWARIGDTVEFVRRISPARAVPIHDGLLSENGRGTYLGHIGNFGAEGGLEVLDLRGRGATSL